MLDDIATLIDLQTTHPIDNATLIDLITELIDQSRHVSSVAVTPATTRSHAGDDSGPCSNAPTINEPNDDD